MGTWGLRTLVPLSLVGCLVAACTGDIGGDGSGDDPNVQAHAQQAVVSGARRLSRTEYDDTLRYLLQDASNSGFAQLPEDVNDPFDNNYKTQLVSRTLIEAAEKLATDAADRALADKAIHDKIIPCTPTGPGDVACLTKFIQTFGRRALRRPLAADEVTGYLGLQAYAVEGNDFDIGVKLVIQAMLQDVEFLYRIELGKPVDGVAGAFRLNDYEVATRLAFFLTGTTPDDALLDVAGAGKLRTPDQIRAAAATLLQDPRAKSRVERFHALWLSYHQLPHPAALTKELRAESDALVSRVVFDEKHDYFDLFTFDKTFVNDDLATHYGLTPPGSATGAWVSYGKTGRKGLLSHGSVLSAGAKFSDTSPTQRGKFVRTRLLCQEIPPPPPNVKSDLPPDGPMTSCKIDKYKAHATQGSCKSCHQQMDPIGFGLENYDTAGVYRATEAGKPECKIDGNGELTEAGAFNGPAGLADKLIESGLLESCVVLQVYRFAIGRRELDEDAALIDALATGFKGNHHAFDELLLDVVSADSFGFRKEEP